MGRLFTVVTAGPVFRIHNIGGIFWHEPVPHAKSFLSLTSPWHLGEDIAIWGCAAWNHGSSAVSRRKSPENIRDTKPRSRLDRPWFGVTIFQISYVKQLSLLFKLEFWISNLLMVWPWAKHSTSWHLFLYPKNVNSNNTSQGGCDH